MANSARVATDTSISPAMLAIGSGEGDAAKIIITPWLEGTEYGGA